MNEGLLERLRSDFRPEATCAVTGRKFTPIKSHATLRQEREEAATEIERLSLLVEEAKKALTMIEAYTTGGYDDGKSPPRRDEAISEVRALLAKLNGDENNVR